MPRDGFRIFDSDTHVGPSMNILDRYLAQAEKARLADWEQWKDINARTGRITYTKGGRRYQRRLGSAIAEEAPAGYMAAFTGANRARRLWRSSAAIACRAPGARLPRSHTLRFPVRRQPR